VDDYSHKKGLPLGKPFLLKADVKLAQKDDYKIREIR
jgi:hypothetical protein